MPGGRGPRLPGAQEKQHLDNLRRKSSAQRSGNGRVSVHLYNDSASNIEGSAYTLLTRMEAAFRAMKSPLMERPIFHHLQRRTETHIFLCIVAYHLLVAIEK